MGRLTIHNSARTGLLILAIVTLCLVGAILMTGWGRPAKNPVEQQAQLDRATQEQIDHFCSTCHQVPRPSDLPRASWKEEIPKAFQRWRDSGREAIVLPDETLLTEYFTRVSPEKMVIPSSRQRMGGPVPFAAEVVDIPDGYAFAAVSYLQFEPRSSNSPNMASRLLVCDLGSGFLHRLNWNGTGLTDTVLGRLKNPDHVAACDFDRDGFQDFVVADLGGIQPTNERTGSVFLLRGRDPAGQFDVETVQEGLGRVADVEVADLDGDGDHDFLVAEFGFETLGRLIWLETLAIEQGFPRTRLHVIDTRHGAIHAPPIDLDGDGDMDLIALFSQEHETIVAFFNDGRGTFAAKELFTAPTPSFGSSGLELVDLDQDGDQDVIFTNGDTLDKFQLKPFHAVHWLENRGNQQFDYHHLTNLPGAIRAVAGDLDGDGDLDIAAAAFCPSLLLHQTRPAVLDTLIWLEQTAPGEFARHVVDRSDPGHMSLATGDLNGDGRLDLVVGEFTPNDTSVRRWLKIFWNRRPLPRDENDQTPREEPIP